jgi:hypothetical protein
MATRARPALYGMVNESNRPSMAVISRRDRTNSSRIHRTKIQTPATITPTVGTQSYMQSWKCLIDVSFRRSVAPWVRLLGCAWLILPLTRLRRGDQNSPELHGSWSIEVPDGVDTFQVEVVGLHIDPVVG